MRSLPTLANPILLTAVALATLATPTPAQGQDKFEIEVYQYETAPRGAWELETHANFTARGTRVPDGIVAPTDNQFHLAFELTRGLTDFWEISAYVLTAHRSDAGAEFAGWRLRSRLRLPESWKLPVNVSLSGELGLPRPVYGENSLAFEFTPILEKRIGPVQLDLNLSLERDLQGPEAREGWEFEPAGRVAVDLSPRLALELEYFGALGHLSDPLPANAQVHQFYPGVDLRLGDDVEWNLGVGVGATSAGNQLVFKTMFEVPIGGRSDHEP